MSNIKMTHNDTGMLQKHLVSLWSHLKGGGNLKVNYIVNIILGKQVYFSNSNSFWWLLATFCIKIFNLPKHLQQLETEGEIL